MKTGSGIRQGCGLAPLLWVSFTVLLFDKFTQYLSLSQISGFADNLHMHWIFDEPRQFRNACAQVGFILSDLADMGMQVSVDKTVHTVSIGGPLLQSNHCSICQAQAEKKVPACSEIKALESLRQSIARYGLDSVGLDEVSASRYRSHTARQLRRIAHSLGHLTRESNSSLHARLAVPDPVSTLCEAICSRVQSSRRNVGHLHSHVVSQRLTQLVDSTGE